MRKAPAPLGVEAFLIADAPLADQAESFSSV